MFIWSEYLLYFFSHVKASLILYYINNTLSNTFPIGPTWIFVISIPTTNMPYFVYKVETKTFNAILAYAIPSHASHFKSSKRRRFPVVKVFVNGNGMVRLITYTRPILSRISPMCGRLTGWLILEDVNTTTNKKYHCWHDVLWMDTQWHYIGCLNRLIIIGNGDFTTLCRCNYFNTGMDSQMICNCHLHYIRFEHNGLHTHRIPSDIHIWKKETNRRCHDGPGAVPLKYVEDCTLI